MKSYKKKNIWIFAFLAIIISNLVFISLDIVETDLPKEEKEFSVYSSYTSVSSIFINGTANGIGARNWTWAESQTWCSGNGTVDEPYIITGLSIDGQGNSIPIYIINSDKYFNITNCILFNSIEADYDNLYRAGIVLENVLNGRIRNNNCSNNNANGISIRNSINVTIRDNIMDANYWGGIRINASEDMIILNNTIKNSDYYDAYGIYMHNSNNSFILDNKISFLNDGIYQIGNDCIIENNTLEDIQYISIYIEGNNINIRNNTVRNVMGLGIFLGALTHNVTIEKNLLDKGGDYGILINGNNITVFNNTVGNFTYCIYLWEDSDHVNCTNNIIKGSLNTYNVGIRLYINGKFYTIDENKMINCGISTTPRSNQGRINITTSNTVDDKPIYYYYNRSGLNTLDFTHIGAPGQIILWNCNNSQISNFKISVNNFTVPIMGFYCNDLLFYNNTFSNNILGIHLEYSNFLNISNNILSYNWRRGISFGCCYNVSVINNTIYNNGDDGIWFSDSTIEVINNKIYRNKGSGLNVYSFNEIRADYNRILNNTIINNLEDGLKISTNCELKISNNNISNNKYYGIHFSNDNYTLILNNTFYRNGAEGIRFVNGKIGLIKNNTFEENGIRYPSSSCILLHGPDNIEITENNFINTDVGVHLTSYSENNTIYLNKFIENDINAIDDGYNNQWDNGTIGNYWDDYIGIDLNHDNIGDLPYTSIDGSADSQDRYPIWNNNVLPSPIWNEIPINQTIELGNNFSYRVDAFSPLEINYYTLNLTIFTIDANGLITNESILSVGDYWIKIHAFDMYNQNCTATIKITVEDTIGPTWDTTPSDQIIEYYDTFIYDVDASDLSGIEYYWINDEVNFNINNITGQITNATVLEAANYELVIRAYDPYGNYCEETIKITVITPEEQIIPGYDILFIISLIGALTILILLYKNPKIKN